MPQMAPLSWLNLYIFFIMIFMLFNTMNYFSFMYKNLNLNKKKSKKLFYENDDKPVFKIWPMN